jgi:hypothetical protein
MGFSERFALPYEHGRMGSRSCWKSAAHLGSGAAAVDQVKKKSAVAPSKARPGIAAPLDLARAKADKKEERATLVSAVAIPLLTAQVGHREGLRENNTLYGGRSARLLARGERAPYSTIQGC